MAAKMMLKDATSKAPLSFLRTSVLAAAQATTTTIPSNSQQLIQALPINTQKPLPDSEVLRQYLYDIDFLNVQGPIGVYGYWRSEFGVETRGSRRGADEDEDEEKEDDDDKVEDFCDDDDFDCDGEDDDEFHSDDDGDNDKKYKRK